MSILGNIQASIKHQLNERSIRLDEKLEDQATKLEAKAVIADKRSLVLERQKDSRSRIGKAKSLRMEARRERLKPIIGAVKSVQSFQESRHKKQVATMKREKTKAALRKHREDRKPKSIFGEGKGGVF